MLKSYCFAYLQYLLPQHLLSVFAGKLANIRYPLLKNWMIRYFINRYQVDLSDALQTQVEAYDTFNQFFTRPLQANARPIAIEENTLISPVDGCISQIGCANGNQLLQAKGFHFTLEGLLGGDKTMANYFQDGLFATFYLAPRDYHRVHLPTNGTLLQTIYVPGKLFSVNHTTANHIPDLYSRNERLIALLDTDAGKMAVILVGAMLVGQIQPAWSSTPARHTELTHNTFSPPLAIKKGDQVGYFCLGSTVIVLFEKNRIQWTPTIATGVAVKMGQAIGSISDNIKF